MNREKIREKFLTGFKELLRYGENAPLEVFADEFLAVLDLPRYAVGDVVWFLYADNKATAMIIDKISIDSAGVCYAGDSIKGPGRVVWAESQLYPSHAAAERAMKEKGE